MTACLNNLCFTAEFFSANGAIDHLVIAAVFRAGRECPVFGHGSSFRMSRCRESAAAYRAFSTFAEVSVGVAAVVAQDRLEFGICAVSENCVKL